MVRPLYLQPGDKVALLSPSGYTTDKQLEQAKRLLEAWQLVPVVAPHAQARNGQLAGTEQERLSDFQQALDDEEVQAIWCSNGQYGALQIVEQADYSTFQGNPKWLIGMDDITVLHAKLHALGIESLHACMPANLDTTLPEAVTQSRNFLFGIISSYAIPPHPLNREGFARAELVGGMLTWIHSLHATRIEHNTRNTLLFIEEQGKTLYDMDRAIRCLKYGGKLQHLKGLIVGLPGEKAEPGFQEAMDRLIREAVEEYDYPVCFGFPAGHVAANYPLILGAEVELEIGPENCELRFT